MCFQTVAKTLRLWNGQYFAQKCIMVHLQPSIIEKFFPREKPQTTYYRGGDASKGFLVPTSK